MKFFYILKFIKHDKTQLLAKFKQILYMGFRATLTFQKFKVALNLMCRIFLNFAKSCVLSCLTKFKNIKKRSPCRFGIKTAPKAVIKGVLAGHTVAMVTYCVTKMKATCSPMIGQSFDAMIVASSDK